MAEVVPLLSVHQTLAAVSALRERCDRSLTLARGLVGVSDVTIASMIVLVEQLDAIARSAAAYSTGTPDPDRYAELQERLLAAGYLPLPRETAKEPADGAR
ncbi:hypothetical protein [Methylobacterium iners]|uniref:Uncharacterized protein n=1 Tax=Methylobacterium iners TaxID=418707 RepID=A0ABQ4S3T0_9HYPH|nr:hypothetical protein [Methylobacterium iners]GJD97749.1 hypothetical protein OCOJLMKI_4982 [Methylobacterium iners]